MKKVKLFLKKRRVRIAKDPSAIFSINRAQLVVACFFLIFSMILIRALGISTLPPSEQTLARLTKKQYERKIKLSPYRGAILDRRGDPLAISIRKSSIFINPQVFSPTTRQRRKIANTLGVTPEFLKKIQKKKSYFAWVKRKIEFDQAKELDAMNIEGMHQIMEPSRFYPSGRAASQLLGYVGTDNEGLMGLELEYNQLLSGEQGQVYRARDAKGRSIFTGSAAPEKVGGKIQLTLDRVIQEIAENALAKGVENAKAKSGFAIVSDPHTGRILAVANYPSFDPNQRGLPSITKTKNNAFLDLYEPGSVIKPLVLAEALSQKKTTLHSVHDTHEGVYRGDRWRIRDTHPSESLTSEEIIVESSNIGTYKLAQLIGKKSLFETYLSFGIGSKDNLVGFPQQSIGRLQSYEDWRELRFANIAFGQGLVVNALEMVSAYGAIANGGHLMKPILVDHLETDDLSIKEVQSSQIIRRVIPAKVAKQLRGVLEKTVLEGSGQNAQMELYSSAGKTGTSEKVDPKTKAYSNDLRIASFIGFSPVNDPHLVVYVVVDEPSKRPYYGGLWAAPIFKEITESSLKYLNVSPDKIQVASKEDRQKW